MIEKFEIDILLFSVVAGAINSNLHIGDLIIATKLCQHDLDITAFGHPYGYVPESKIFVESNKTLNEIAKKVATKLNKKLIEGIIATGDQFIADSKKKEWIKETFQADAIEMEGASVGFVCDALGVPFFVLRAISDSADMDAGFDFDKFLESSAKESAKLLMEMVKEIR
jgi:adenosylhomocysteine/aminodeoxyfutalosine nucleosidase